MAAEPLVADSKPMSARRRTDTNGMVYFHGLVQKATDDFMEEYKGFFSKGVALDNLVIEVKKLREELQQLRNATTTLQNMANPRKIQ